VPVVDGFVAGLQKLSATVFPSWSLHSTGRQDGQSVVDQVEVDPEVGGVEVGDIVAEHVGDIVLLVAFWQYHISVPLVVQPPAIEL